MLNIKPVVLAFSLGAVALGCTDETEAIDVVIEPVRGQPQSPIESTLDIAAADSQWHAQLEHSRIDLLENGFTIVGVDAHDNVIGRITVAGIAEDIVSITHEYPRQCEQEHPGAEGCADTLHVTVHLAEQWTDAWANAPAALFSDRATAIAAKLPPDTAEGKVRCALTVAASAAACASSPVPGVGIIACLAGAYESLCACRSTFQLAFPDVDFDEICD